MMCLLWYNQLVSMNVWLAAAFINHYFLFCFLKILVQFYFHLLGFVDSILQELLVYVIWWDRLENSLKKQTFGEKTKRNWTTEGQSEDIGFDSDNNVYVVFQYWGISHICRLQLQSTYWWPVANIHINIFFLFFAFYVS